MNMILKKRLADRKRRGGFTLVEVIVVLVILAILAAIAIPALTGYIDKAKWRELEHQVRMQRMGMQTMLTEMLVRDGDIKKYSPVDYATSDRLFREVQQAANGAYRAFGFTEKGKLEYEELTGDTKSFAKLNASTVTSICPDIYFDASGAIGAYNFFNSIDTYGGAVPAEGYLLAIYVDELDAWSIYTQRAVAWMTDKLNSAKSKGMTNGINIMVMKDETSSNKWLQWERLN
ncbi:MAG: prepilin-type N-terminal cleavage/methylation domain-containing protein [Clostridiales Family XIII bacterium]|jgi:prepilin-type N-terminal cleavage/methylation domain-containing protein|nr:prepilin-type N-terminal cleavage/methylation domain-containing protein [Clostridiales Family XIII bacterium]